VGPGSRCRVRASTTKATGCECSRARWALRRQALTIKESAGILLYRLAAGGPEVLLVHPGGPFWSKKDLGAWSIPKGEPDPGEELLAAALRELREELGAPPELVVENLLELGSVRQRNKVVHGWAAEADFDPATLDCNTFAMEWPPRSGVEQEFPEVDRADWFGAGAAKEKLIEAQAAFVDRLLERLA
jgi:predicted NUDIX family NTP pyrophosphohydrolase